MTCWSTLHGDTDTRTTAVHDSHYSPLAVKDVPRASGGATTGTLVCSDHMWRMKAPGMTTVIIPKTKNATTARMRASDVMTINYCLLSMVEGRFGIF
jgi:hypothetical protein